MNVVCYHYPCIDGIYAALAAHIHFKETGQLARFFPLTVYKDHTCDELSLQGTETVYLCDFAGPPGFAIAVAAKVARLIVLDHHKTGYEMFAGAELPANIELRYDLLRSGATIALDFFKPSVTPALKEAFRYVEDADLWTWKLPDSREFNAGISALNLEYDVHKNPDIFQTLQGLNNVEIVACGRQEILTQEQFIDSCKSSCFHVQLGGLLGTKHDWGTALAVQIDSSMSKHRSRLGNDLAEMAKNRGLRPIAVVAYREKEMDDTSKIKLSLRGRGDATDTTPIAEAFGGGGHRLASSCIVTVEDFNTWRQAA